jgi:CheY-like chemotaxis protein
VGAFAESNRGIFFLTTFILFTTINSRQSKRFMSTKKTILIVDDDPVSQNILLDKLKGAFGKVYRYEKATSAQEAEDIILAEMTTRGALPSLIICDWIIPDKRGDQLMNEIATLYPEIPLVLYSIHADFDMENQLNQNVSLLCRLPKPWDGITHIDKLRQVLEN